MANIDPGTIAAVATIAGAVITALVSLGIFLKRKRDQRRRLRKALWHEIKSVSGFVDDPGLGQYVQKKPGSIPKEVYKSSSSIIGSLSDKEVESVVQYYSSVIGYEHLVEVHRELPVNEEDSEQIITQTVGNILGNKALALHHLSKKLDPQYEPFELLDEMSSKDRDIMLAQHELASEAPGERPNAGQIADECGYDVDFVQNRLEEYVDLGLYATQESDGEATYHRTHLGAAYIAGEMRADEVEDYQDNND